MNAAFAQLAPAAPGTPVAPIEEPPPAPAKRRFVWTDGLFSSERRGDERFAGFAIYSPFDLIVPSKIGVAADWIASDRTSFELEWVRASYGVPFILNDFGSFTDQRVALLRRSFMGFNSFNLFYGVSYFALEARVGNAILRRAPVPGAQDALKYEALGLAVGIGNRWTVPHGITLGIDWIEWAQPLVTLGKDETLLNDVVVPGDRDQIDRFFRAAAYLPRITVLKLEAGWAF